MAKKTERNASEQPPLDISMRGGAGTFRGVDYQLRAAALYALGLMQRQIDSPHLAFSITVEPVEFGEERTEKWDFSIREPLEVFEAKVAPTADDIREFLARSSTSEAGSCVLVYGERKGALFAALEWLRRAREAAGDSRENFDRVLSAAAEEHKEAASRVGSDPYAVLGRLDTQNIPPDVLDQNLENLARALAGEQSDELLSLLTREFLAAAPHRRTFVIGELTRLALDRQIALGAPHETSRDLPAPTKAMLLLLDSVSEKFPAELLAVAVGADRGSVEGDLAMLEDRGVVECSPGTVLWRLATLPSPVISPVTPDVLSRALSAILAWIPSHSMDPSLDAAVMVAVNLSELVEDSDPVATALSFAVLDKHLKRRGDRQLIYRTANRSIEAAKRAHRSEQVAEAEAIALICGRSWVFQRVGELDKARADGEASLQIGLDLGDDRNTAFCHRCLGRMCRLEAESVASAEIRAPLLEQSRTHLVEAIARFEDLREDAEVGDAYSLLGRTQLARQDLDACEESIRQAASRLSDPRHKDYIDLQILRGDLATERGETSEAMEIFSEVLDLSGPAAVPGEMRARTLRQRGLLRDAPTEQAIADLNAAADIYDDLGEHTHGALPRLRAMELEGRFESVSKSADVGRLMDDEQPLIRVLAMRDHETAVAAAAYTEAAVAFRDQATTRHWQGMIRKARREAAVLGKFW